MTQQLCYAEFLFYMIFVILTAPLLYKIFITLYQKSKSPPPLTQKRSTQTDSAK
jgi:hypothetical protein